MKSVTLLGATGSIGVSTLDVIAQHPERFSVFALSACRNVERLFQQCQTFKPRYAVLTEPQAAEQLYALLQQVDLPTQVLVGEDALCQIASDPEVDYVMAAIVGAAGLKPAIAAAQAGKRVLLANKEALVMSGQLFMDAIQASGAELLPIDSEHNAIFQCLPTQNRQQGVQKLVLTASGGPFRTWAKEHLINVTPAQAVAHPNWSMGQKISVDSATLMNKGLETIEACWLFNVSMEQIEVVVHPQSTIHSMVTYCDGSVLAQLGNPDMRTPIAYALGYPERLPSGVKPLDFIQLARLDFERPDTERFPCLRLASEAHQAGGYATIALNAANEEAVQAFLKQQIGFMDIPRLIEQVVAQARAGTPTTLETIFIQDKDSREAALSWIKTKKMQ